MRSEESSNHGTRGIDTPCTNMSFCRTRRALWLCRRASHQCPTMYCGMYTVMTSEPCLVRCSLMYLMSGELKSRYGEVRIRSFTWMFCLTQAFLWSLVDASSTDTCTASNDLCCAPIA